MSSNSKTNILKYVTTGLGVSTLVMEVIAIFQFKKGVEAILGISVPMSPMLFILTIFESLVFIYGNVCAVYAKSQNGHMSCYRGLLIFAALANLAAFLQIDKAMVIDSSIISKAKNIYLFGLIGCILTIISASILAMNKPSANEYFKDDVANVYAQNHQMPPPAGQNYPMPPPAGHNYQMPPAAGHSV